MAEGRMLKKEISDSKKLGAIGSDRPRVLYLMMLPHLDIKGRLKADPQKIKGQVCTMLPYSAKSIQAALEALHEVGLIVLYQNNGEQFLEYTRFDDFQKLYPDKEAETKIPDPTPANSSELQRTPLKDKVSKGKASKDKCPIYFDSFWEPYPRKEAKGRAVKWFTKNNPTEDDVAKMIYTIEQQKKCGGRLAAAEKKFIPLPETWLNDGDWRDAPGKAELDKEQEERQQAENTREAQKQQQIRNEYIGYYEERTTEQLHELRENKLHSGRRWLIDEVLEKRQER